MVEEKRHAAGAAPEPDGAGTAPLFEPAEIVRASQRNVELMSRAARACFTCATEINREAVEFLNRRVKRDFEAASALMRSRNGEDALSAHADFVEEAFRDYADETTRMFDIAAKATRIALRPSDL